MSDSSKIATKFSITKKFSRIIPLLNFDFLHLISTLLFFHLKNFRAGKFLFKNFVLKFIIIIISY